MYLVTKAHRLRERARERLFEGDAREAWELARAAESAAPTLAGKRPERLPPRGGSAPGRRCDSEEDRDRPRTDPLLCSCGGRFRVSSFITFAARRNPMAS